VNAITKDATTGRYSVDDPEMRREIMQLCIRSDPQRRHDRRADAEECGSADRSNRPGADRRRALHGEAYMAHFLGAGGAGKLIDLVAATRS
jgi:hypothetical protein